MSSTRGPVLVRPAASEHPADHGVWVARFGRTERFAHWWTVVMVSLALLTGLGMGDDSGSGPMLVAHVGSVVLIGAGLVAAFLFGDRKALITATRRLFSLDREDIAWVRDHLRNPLTAARRHDWGLFNTGQKLLAWTLTVSMAAVIGTGIQSWMSGGEGGLHGAAVVVCAALLGAHIFMAVINPSTRPALHGMVFGRVRRSWAATHHKAWLATIDESGPSD
jgi:formate dehydrogenase subunit gamma